MVHKFLVLTHSRSGSNLLVRGLNAHPQVVCLGEVLKSPDMPRSVSALCTSAELEQELRAACRDDTARFTELFFELALDRGASAAGFKLFYYHALKDGRDGVWRVLEEQPDVRIVHLSRDNVFDVYLSRSLAVTSGRWFHPSKAGPEADYERTVTIDLEDFETFRSRLSARRDDAMRRIRPAQSITLTYDQLAGDFDATMRQMFSFLGVSDTPVKPALHRQRTRHRWEYVDNAAEVQAHLRESGLGWMV